MSEEDNTGQRTSTSPDPLEQRVRTLESTITFARGIALVVCAIMGTSLGAVGAGAMATRDASLAHGARLTALEATAALDLAARGRREEADRASRDQFIEMRADLRAMRQEVETLSHLLQRQEDDRGPGAGPRRAR